MKETHTTSSSSASAPQRLSASGHTIPEHFGRFVFYLFSIPISSIFILSVYKSTSYSCKIQTDVFGYEVLSDWLSGLKFEIVSIVFRLRRGNLPVRINEYSPSLSY